MTAAAHEYTAALVDATRRFGSDPHVVTALDSVSVEFRSGTLTAIVGPSGSGKTTLLHLLAGWDTPDHGEVRRSHPTIDWGSLAIVPQNIGLLDELTVAENLELPSRLAGQTAPELEGMAATLGVDHLLERLPVELSLGEQQRVAVLRAVAYTPLLLIADEPTAHQDEANADRVMALLRAKADAGSCVVVSTHDRRLLGEFPRQLHLEHGVVVETGS